MAAKVIPIRQGTTSKQERACPHMDGCPLYETTHHIDLEAAIYMLIDREGSVYNGNKGVRRRHAEDLIDALERVSFRLHGLLAKTA